jgi:hypothetical protein
MIIAGETRLLLLQKTLTHISLSSRLSRAVRKIDTETCGRDNANPGLELANIYSYS